MKIVHLSFCMLLTLFTHAQIGDPAPDFIVTDVHGGKHRLYDYLNQGKTVVLDFFFTTCIPCQYYAPQVNKAYTKYGCNTQDVIFLSIDYNDTNLEVKAYEDQFKIEFPSISGKEGGGNAVVSQYKIIAFPTFLVIDSTKKIIDKVDPPTVIVFDFIFGNHGIVPKSCLTKIKEAENKNKHRIIENPVYKGIISLQLLEANSDWQYFNLIDLSGKILKSFSVFNSDSSEIQLDVRDVANGIYLLQSKSKGKDPVYQKVFLTGN